MRHRKEPTGHDVEGSVPALDRAHRILSLIATRPDGVSLSEISRTTKIPSSTLYRILSSLDKYGYVQRRAARHIYVLGKTLVRLGGAAIQRIDLATLATPFMTTLSKVLSETVKLSVPRGNEVEVVARVESSSKMRISVDVGARFPIHAGAASKTLLAFLSEARVESIIADGLERYTAQTIVDPQVLRETLGSIREQLIAYDNEEFIDGIKAVASPVFNFMGDAVAALSVAYLAAQDRDEGLRIERERHLRETAAQISAQLGAVTVISH